MEASLAKRIAQALADAENPSSDCGELLERLESLASEATERYQLLCVAQSYLLFPSYAHIKRTIGTNHAN